MNERPNVDHLVWRARLALAWEAFWPLAWPLPAIATLFVAVAWLDVLPRLPGWLHTAVLVGFAAAGLWALTRLRRFVRPRDDQARRRLERDSALRHRPLQLLDDGLAAGIDDSIATSLWRAERRRRAQALGSLRVRLPSPGLAGHDPWGLRFAPWLLLAIAIAAGSHDPGARLRRALEPGLDGFGGPPALLQLWITPPAYTGLPPLLLQGEEDGHPLRVPVGSRLLAELHGGNGAARLLIDGTPQPFVALDAASQRLETTLAAGSRLSVRQGRHHLAGWSLEVVADRPPTVGFAAPPAADADGRLRLAIEAHDDYGVETLSANLRRLDDPRAATATFALPVGGKHPKDLRQDSWLDLASHPWAGLKVSLQPEATDGAHQSGLGAAVTLVLPERSFHHPVARAIAALRRALAADPGSRTAVIDRLAAIAGNPDSYGDNRVAFLLLATARSRLIRDASAEAVPSVLDMMWEAALRIEEGDRHDARAAFDEASRQLQQALADGASDAELSQLMDSLKEAMQRYLQALARQGAQLEAQTEDGDQAVLSEDDLAAMMNQLDDLSRTGARQAATDMLARLQDLMDGLVPATGTDSMEQRQAKQALQALRGLAGNQQALLDKTFRQSRQGPPPSDRERQADAAAENGLRQRLGQIKEALQSLGPAAAPGLDKADRAMGKAGEGLRSGDLEGAVAAESEALAQMQESARAASKSLAERAARALMPGHGGGPGHDPLGRPLPGTGFGDDEQIKIPSQAELGKAREILDEVRRRAGEAERPAAERDYLRRLLDKLF